MLRDIACLCPFCSTHLCFMVISCFTCINYLNMCSIIIKAKRTFALDKMLQTNLLDYLKSFFFFHNLEIGLPSCTQGKLFTKLYKSSTTKTAQRLSLQQLITITTWQVIRLIHLVPVKHNSSPPSILSLIPWIGPLHVSLNGREMLFNDFSPFSANNYEQPFPKCKLGKHPKPWRKTKILETVYGGWFHKRDSVKDKFKQRRLLPSFLRALPLFRRDCFRSMWWKHKFYIKFRRNFRRINFEVCR